MKAIRVAIFLALFTILTFNISYSKFEAFDAREDDVIEADSQRESITRELASLDYQIAGAQQDSDDAHAYIQECQSDGRIRAFNRKESESYQRYEIYSKECDSKLASLQEERRSLVPQLQNRLAKINSAFGELEGENKDRELSRRFCVMMFWLALCIGAAVFLWEICPPLRAIVITLIGVGVVSKHLNGRK